MWNVKNLDIQIIFTHCLNVNIICLKPVFLSFLMNLLFPESSTRPYRERPAPGGHKAHVPRAFPLHAFSFEPRDHAHPCLTQPGLPWQSLTSLCFFCLSLPELHWVSLRAGRRANLMQQSPGNQQTHTLTNTMTKLARVILIEELQCWEVFRESVEMPVLFYELIFLWLLFGVKQAG